MIPKPAKPVGDPKSYRLISLLCVPYKILERLIYACIKPLIDPLLPKEQAGFRHGKSTVDQVVLLTQNIKDYFEAKKKASAIFVDLTADMSRHDMSALAVYLQTWRLKLSYTKTVTAAFHLNNQEAKCQLKVYKNSRLLPFCPIPTYLGVKLDRLLTFRQHLVALCKKTILMRHTAEATHWLRMGCWC